LNRLTYTVRSILRTPQTITIPLAGRGGLCSFARDLSFNPGLAREFDLAIPEAPPFTVPAWSHAQLGAYAESEYGYSPVAELVVLNANAVNAGVGVAVTKPHGTVEGLPGFGGEVYLPGLHVKSADPSEFEYLE